MGVSFMEKFIFTNEAHGFILVIEAENQAAAYKPAAKKRHQFLLDLLPRVAQCREGYAILLNMAIDGILDAVVTKADPNVLVMEDRKPSVLQSMMIGVL
jgi:hypothetical protein